MSDPLDRPEHPAEEVRKGSLYQWRPHALPTTPPPGPLDIAMSRLVHRLCPRHPRSAALMLDMLGRGTRPPLSPKDAALRHGVTASWARLVRGRVGRYARQIGPPDALAAAITCLSTGSVRTAARAALAVWETGVTAEVFHPAAVRAAAALYGMDTGFELVELQGGGIVVVPAQHSGGFEDFTAEFRRQIRFVGIVDTCALGEAYQLDAEVIDQVAAAHQWQRSGQFAWKVSGRQTGLGRRVYRMLALGPHTVEELALGLSASQRYRTTRFEPPPLALLARWLESQPDLWVEGNLVGATVALPVNRADAVLVAAFGSGDQELATAELYRALQEAGLARGRDLTPLHLAITSSPVVIRSGDGRWRALVGSPRPAVKG